MDAHGVWLGGFATRLDDGRGHVVTVDLLSDEGGLDAGTSALELSVLALAGCISTIFAIVARKRRLSYDGFEVSLSAERPPGSPTLQRVLGTVEVRTSASPEEVETALRLTVKTCPVGVIFEQAKIPVEVRCHVVPTGGRLAETKVIEPSENFEYV